MKDRQLKVWQEQAIAYLQKRIADGHTGGTLWMEMRLGKSWATLIFALTHMNFQRILVLCPAKPILDWTREFQSMGVTYLPLVGTAEKKKKLLAKIPEHHITICTYNAAIDYGLLSKEHGWDCIVLDETFLLASPSSKRTRELWAWHGKEFRIGLSGNPGAESPLNLVTQYLAVDGHIGKYTTPYDFIFDNCDVDQYGKYVLKQGQGAQILQWMQANSFCMTRQEAGLKGDKEYGYIYCAMPDDLRKLHNAIVEDRVFQRKWNVDGKQVQLDPMMRANWLWMISSGVLPGNNAEVTHTHKIDGLVSWLQKNDIKKGVIFAYFTDECRKMTQALQDAGFTAAGMWGTTTLAKQTEVMEEFNTGKLQFQVLEEIAFKMGVNCSVTDNFFYLSNALSGDARSQSEDRGIHQDKEHNIIIRDVVCIGGADSYISEKVKDKTFTAKDMLTQGAQYLKEIEKWTEKDL